MRFLYRYQDREKGVVDAEISAPSESEAYTLLRKSGIRPMKVWAKPGVLNALASIGKRGWTIVALAIIAIVVIAKLALVENDSDGKTYAEVLQPLQRGQVAHVTAEFRFSSEKALALFVRPGEVTDEMSRLQKDVFADLPKAIKSPTQSSKGDDADVVLLRRMVVGLKNEARIALASGLSPEAFLEQLIERQRMERAYRKNVIDSIVQESRNSTSETVQKRLKAVNASFAITGLKEVDAKELEERCKPPLTAN